MSKKKILTLMHAQLVPPDDLSEVPEAERARFQTELDVVTALEQAGHEVQKLGVDYELQPLRTAIRRFKPDIVFNLLEEFAELRQFDQNVVGFLELLGVPYTGCNPRGLTLARDKALSKKILHYHRIPVPKFFTVDAGRKPRRPKRIEFPLIVKPLWEEGSTGISKASVVRSDEKLAERIRYIHERIGSDAIVEEYIEGREVYSAILGNQRTTVCPTWELIFEKKAEGEPLINTQKAKWDQSYQDRLGVVHGPANLSPELEKKVMQVTKRIYRTLGLSGYARIDYRLREDGSFFFLEANPNPDIMRDGEFATAAAAAGLSYEQLLDRIVRLGAKWRPARTAPDES